MMSKIPTWAFILIFVVGAAGPVWNWFIARNLPQKPLRDFSRYRRVRLRPRLAAMVFLFVLLGCSLWALYKGSEYAFLLLAAFIVYLAWAAISISGRARKCPECHGDTEAYYEASQRGGYKEYYYVCHRCKLCIEGGSSEPSA
jgi:uncharacterized membrane protein YbaN (DUF454 family)